MLNKLYMQIKSLERHYGITQRVMILGTDDLNQCSDDKLKAYLEYLRNGQEYQPNIEPEHIERMEGRSSTKVAGVCYFYLSREYSGTI